MPSTPDHDRAGRTSALGTQGRSPLPSVAAPERGRPLNILTFNYEYPPLGGGGGVFHEVMAEELAKHHHVAVITSAFGDLPSFEVRGGVEIHRVPIIGRGDPSAASLLSMLAFPPAAWWAAGRLMRRKRYDVIHAHFAVPTGRDPSFPHGQPEYRTCSASKVGISTTRRSVSRLSQCGLGRRSPRFYAARRRSSPRRRT